MSINKILFTVVFVSFAASAYGQATLFFDDFSAGNAGWFIGNAWTIGPAVAGGGSGGGGSGNPDPGTDTSTTSDNNILGNVLGGNYPISQGTDYATTPTINCSSASVVELSFQRWLNVEKQYSTSSPWDVATVEVTNNGTNWTTYYSNPTGTDETDSAWTLITYNISATAANQASVQIRWSLKTDSSVVFCGWNIDDVTVRDPSAPPSAVSSPSPADQATGVSTYPNLTWSAPPTATSYDVYFGLFAASTPTPALTGANLVSTQAGASYAPAGPLNLGGEYHWRVDSKNAGGITQGTEYVFTVTNTPPPGQVSSPSPANGATNVASGTALTWTAGTPSATSYNVYFGTTSPVGGTPVNVTSATHSPTITPNNIYYWRVDAVDATGTLITTGIEYSFSSVGAVFLPYSDDFSVNNGWTGLATGFWDIASASVGTSSGGSGNPDPSTDNSSSADNQILGFTIGSDYQNNMSVHKVTSPKINCSTNTNVTLSFYEWLGIESLTYDLCGIEVSNDGQTYNTVWTDASGTGAYAGGAWVPVSYDISQWAAGQAQVWIRFYFGVTDVNVVYCGWSIDDILIYDNTAPPPAASNPSPADMAQGVSTAPTLSWTGFPNVTYNVYFTSTPPTQPVTPPVIASGDLEPNQPQAGNSYILPSQLTAGATYYWRIDTISAGGGTTQGTEWSFTVIPPAPSAVANGSEIPADGSTGVLTNIQLQWGASTGAQDYAVYLATVPIDRNTMTPTITTQTRIAPPIPLQANTTTYYWAVDSRNGGGAQVTLCPGTASTGNQWSFTTVLVAPPPAVTAGGEVPANNATGIALNTSLTWAAVTQTGQTITYDVYFGTSLPLTATERIGTAISATTTTIPSAPLSNQRAYYWRIDTNNAGGVATQGPDWVFVTIPNPPGQAVSPTPAIAATGVSITQQLSWSPVTGATSYDVYLSAPGGTVAALGATPTANVTSTFYIPASGLSTASTYEWRVDPKNAGGTTTGTLWTFTTTATATAPNPVTNPTPANNATGVPITQPLSWTGDGTATSYDVYWGVSNPGWPTTGSPVATNVTTTSWTPTSQAYSSTYFWMIMPKNGSGLAPSSTPTVWSYTTESAPVGTLSVNAGSNNPSASTQTASASIVPMIHVRFVSSTESITINSITFTASGTGDDSTSIAKVDLFNDVNGNGRFDTGVDQTLGSQTQTYKFAANNGSCTISGLNFAVSPGTAQDWLLTANFQSANMNDTFTISLDPATGVSATGGTSGQTIAGSGSAITGGQVTISNVGSFTAAKGAATISDYLTQSQTNAPLLQLTVTAGSVEPITVSSITIVSTGTADVQNHVTAWKLYRDTNANGKYDGGEKQEGSTLTGTSGTTTLVFSGFTTTISTGAVVNFLVACDLAPDVPTNTTVSVSLDTSAIAVTGSVSGQTITTTGVVSSGTHFVQTPVTVSTNTVLPPAIVGRAYQIDISATGGSGLYNWSVATGSSLPGGFESYSGTTGAALTTLAGTPTVAGDFTFALTVTDGSVSGNTVDVTFTMVVAPATAGALAAAAGGGGGGGCGASTEIIATDLDLLGAFLPLLVILGAIFHLRRRG
ncbi:MAG: hypothetical protein NUW37_18230 [Planctomycetes bacterium]|nr:hypothetical protein [Planctomycetota bacterium]